MRRRPDGNLIAAFITGIIILAFACLSFQVFHVSAHEDEANDPPVYTYYKSIEIRSGDTLWGIAKENMPSGYDSTLEYVQELMEMNGLSSDNIEAGQHLIIAYSATGFIQ